jgi:hypothetical protein
MRELPACGGVNGATHRQVGDQRPTASTYTPEEARMAEQYARDAMADANWPSDENAHRVRRN